MHRVVIMTTNYVVNNKFECEVTCELFCKLAYKSSYGSFESSDRVLLVLEFNPLTP